MSITFVFLLFSLFITCSTSDFTPQEKLQLENFKSYLRIPTPHPKPIYTAPVTFLTNLISTIPSLRYQTLDFSSVQNYSKPLLLITLPGSDPSLSSILLNSHIDSVPAEAAFWTHPPFSAFHDPETGNIYARGAQDDKCIAIQYIEAIRNLVEVENFVPLRNVHISLVPDEEISGPDGWAQLAKSEVFKGLNVGLILDEGQASEDEELRVFYADRSPWSFVVKAFGAPGHGSRMVDGMAMENLMGCLERVMKFRESQFWRVKTGELMNSEVVSVNLVYLKGGAPTPDGGYVMNVQPSEAEAGFDVRLPPLADPVLLRKVIEEEWAPASRNMTYQLIQKGPIRDINGLPLVTATDDSNPWWSIFKEAVTSSGFKLKKPEILSSTTDARFVREMGISTLGFSPMSNTPILLHDHNEFLRDTVFLKGIKVYENLIRALSSYPGSEKSEVSSI